MLTRRSLLVVTPALAVAPSVPALSATPTLEEVASLTAHYGAGCDIIISRCTDGWMITGYLHHGRVTALGTTIRDGLEQVTEKMRKGIIDPEIDVSEYMPETLLSLEELIERCEPHRVVFGAGRNFETHEVEYWYAYKRTKYPLPLHEVVSAQGETPYEAVHNLWEKLGRP